MELPDYNQIERKPDSGELVSEEGGEDSEHRKKSFAEIWDQNVWGSSSKSGPGSLLRNTGRIREALGFVIDHLKIALNKTSIK